MHRILLFNWFLIDLIQFVDWLRRVLLHKRTNLKKRYGPASWVIVTGGSDGIGAEYAEQMAGEGFNLVLIGKVAEKLETT